MSELMDTVNAIATFVPNAGVSFVPEFNLPDIETMQTVVVPIGCEVQPVGRHAVEMKLKVWVAIVKRVEENEVEGMIDYAQSLGNSLLRQKFGNATCLRVTYNPVYAGDKLRECRQFTSVVEMECKVICAR